MSDRVSISVQYDRRRDKRNIHVVCSEHGDLAAFPLSPPRAETWRAALGLAETHHRADHPELPQPR